MDKKRIMDETTNVLQQILAHVQKNPGGFDKLAPAYVAAWGEIGATVTRDANNPHFGNDYATLEATMKAVKPAFARNKLALMQGGGKLVDGAIEVTSFIFHESGQHIALTCVVPLGGKVTAQAIGSAITYGRRYQAQAIAGLAPADDDGEAASAGAQAPNRTINGPVPAPGKSSAATDGEICAAMLEFVGTAEAFDREYRPRVEEIGSEDVNIAFVKRRQELRKGKK
jgi:hypothetical protein